MAGCIWCTLLRPHLAVCGSALASPAPGGESFSRRPRWPGCPPGYAALQHPACPARPSPAHLPAVAGNPDQTECYRGGGTNYLHWCWWFLMTSNRSLGKYKERSGREVMATEISWKLSHGRKQQRDTRSARWSEKETEGQKGRKRLLSLRLEKIRKQLVGLVLSHEYHFSLRMYSNITLLGRKANLPRLLTPRAETACIGNPFKNK